MCPMLCSAVRLGEPRTLSHTRGQKGYPVSPDWQFCDGGRATVGVSKILTSASPRGPTPRRERKRTGPTRAAAVTSS